jgi:hypothetical protein
VIGFVLLGFAGLVSVVGIVVFSFWGRSSRVEAARNEGAGEEEIQRGLALFWTVRNLCWLVLVVAALTATLLVLAK